MTPDREEKITTELSRLSSLLVESITESRANIKRLEDIQKAHSDSLWDKEYGLEKQVDRLNVAEANRKWTIRALVVGLIGVVGDKIFHILPK